MTRGRKSEAPKAGPCNFQFVTATADLSQFRDRNTMRHVRKTVMHSYLNKAEQDPDCTDVRVVKKRQPTKQQKKASPDASPGTSPDTRAAAPVTADAAGVPVESNVPGLTRRSYSPPVERTDTHRSSGALPTSSPVAIHDRHSLSRSPKSKEDGSQEDSPGGSSDSSVVIINPEDFRYADMALVDRRDIQRERIVFDVAYSHAYGLPVDTTMPDPFASLNPLENENVDIALLKKNCSKYYGSRAMLRQWTSFQTVAPAAFLSCLCISAPYTDLMSKSHTWMETGPNAQIDSQTLELLTEVPRLVTESLKHQGQEISDTNIVAVVQLLAGQITSDHAWIVPAHRSYLKHMIARRGGFDKLGGDGIIGAVICQTDFEAAFMNNEPFDPSYLAYARQFIRDRPEVRFPAPESPVLARNPGMMSIAANRNCSSQTLTVIVLMNQLTMTCQAWNRSERRRSSPVGPYQAEDTDLVALRSTMHNISRRLDQMQPASEPGHNAYNDPYYETIRLAAVLYTHAILHRVPFHEAVRPPPPTHPHGNDVVDPQRPSCPVTPSMVQQSLLRTDMARAWERLGGSLYWVVMVAGAAYHKPKPGHPVRPDLEPRKDSMMAPARKASGRSTRGTEAAPPAHRKHSSWAPTGFDTSSTVAVAATSSSSSSSLSSLPHQAWTPINASQAGSTHPGQPNYVQAPSTWQIPFGRHRGLSQEGGADRPPASSATFSLAGSSGHSSPSPPPSAGPAVPATDFAPFFGADWHPPQLQRLPAPSAPPAASPAHFPSTGPSYGTTNTETAPASAGQGGGGEDDVGQAQNTKRARTRATGRASVCLPIRPGSDEEEQQYRKRYLIANAVRVSILLRFEHTTAMMKAVLALGEVQDYLNGRQS